MWQTFAVTIRDQNSCGGNWVNIAAKARQDTVYRRTRSVQFLLKLDRHFQIEELTSRMSASDHYQTFWSSIATRFGQSGHFAHQPAEGQSERGREAEAFD